MTTRNKGNVKAAARAQSLIAGATKHLTNVTHVTLVGTSYTPAELTARLHEAVVLRNEVEAAKATTKAKLAAETAEGPALHALMGALELYAKATYANAPDVLADFGLHPKPRTPLTAEALAAAAVKRKATRAARNTMGSKQKLAIKGDVVGITVTPVTVSLPAPKADNGRSTATATPAATTAPATHAT